MSYLKTTINTPVQFAGGGQFITNQRWTHMARTMDSFELIIGLKKTLYIRQGGVEYEVNPGDILLLLPEAPHAGYAECEEGVSFYWFHFYCPETFNTLDTAAFLAETDFLKSLPIAERTLSSIYIPYYSRPPSSERLQIIAQQLLHMDNSDYYSRKAMDFLLTSLLIELTEQSISSTHAATEKSRSGKNLTQLMEWVRIYAHQNISVGAIAGQFGYNKDYLSRFFKQRTGITLQSFIHLHKISKTKELLTLTNQTIKEIAYAVGIEDEKYFMRLFKKYEKMTPTEYRKAYYETYLNNT